MVTTTEVRTFTSDEVCAIALVSYRQLDHWCRQSYLQPERSGHPNHHDHGYGTGNARIWTLAETIKALHLAYMVREGITLAIAARLISSGRYAVLDIRPLPDATRQQLADDLPPDSRPQAVIVRSVP